MIKKGDRGNGPVVYWMSRDQRVNDNWALLFAQKLALEQHLPLFVVFCLVPKFPAATIRQYGFMIKGLQELEIRLSEKQIPFFLLTGSPEDEIPEFIEKHKIGMLITDFNPLRIIREWKEAVASKIDITYYEVDAHNIVPCWLASSRQEYSAYTFRPKLNRALSEFLTDFPVLKKHPGPWKEKIKRNNLVNSLKTLNIEHNISEVKWIKPGEREALKVLNNFLKNKLSVYDTQRNDPSKYGQSDLSPYLHFGHVSAQRTALEVSASNVFKKSRDAFLEELIVRRELSDNFCLYNENYDNFSGFPAWAQKTLNEHRKDRRNYIYTHERLENADTHDELWNAAQMEMVKRGKMHGYMRMYWAKKILEWTESPEEALNIAIYLNDKYELDGRDPNGYAGIAWSTGGVHDRAWNERPVFGKIRYMSYNGLKTKFNIKNYIKFVQSL
jgi:deoxyribodipyrimidine photo-lyase